MGAERPRRGPKAGGRRALVAIAATVALLAAGVLVLLGGSGEDATAGTAVDAGAPGRSRVAP